MLHILRDKEHSLRIGLVGTPVMLVFILSFVSFLLAFLVNVLSFGVSGTCLVFLLKI